VHRLGAPPSLPTRFFCIIGACTFWIYPAQFGILAKRIGAINALVVHVYLRRTNGLGARGQSVAPSRRMHRLLCTCNLINVVVASPSKKCVCGANKFLLCISLLSFLDENSRFFSGASVTRKLLRFFSWNDLRQSQVLLSCRLVIPFIQVNNKTIECCSLVA
jgi:hypothetical protein